MKKNTTSGSSFKIENGIPIPPKSRYAWHEMKIGDSVFLPLTSAASISSSLNWAKTKMGGGANFTVRTVDGGVRVWRIA